MTIFLKIVLYIISCIICLISELILRRMNYLTGKSSGITGCTKELLDNICDNEAEKSLIFLTIRTELKIIPKTLKSIINSDLNVGIKIVLCLLCIYMIPLGITISIITDIFMMFTLLMCDIFI